MSDFYLQNNRVGRLHEFLVRLNKLGSNTTTRIAWFRALFLEHESADKVIPELDPELHVRFGNALNEVFVCRDIVRGIKDYSPKLYEDVFSGIYRILRSSWDNQSNNWVNFALELTHFVKNLELICDRVSSHTGYKNIPSDEQVETFFEQISKFKETLKSSSFEPELQVRLERCADRALNCIEKYRQYAINDFYAALEDIWKEIMMYIEFGKNGTKADRQEKVKSSGISDVIRNVQAFLTAIQTGNTLLSQDNCDSMIRSLPWM